MSTVDESIHELREILAEIEYRKKANPIDFFDGLPQQIKFVKSKSKTKGAIGGNRSGKTESGAYYIVSRAVSEKLRIWCCADSFVDSRDVQQRKINNYLPKHLVKYGSFSEQNGFTNNKIILVNGTEITFKTYEQGVSAYDSDDIDIIWNDEEPPLDIVKQQRMRLIDRDGEMIITMTAINGMTEFVADLWGRCSVTETRYSDFLGEELPVALKGDNIEFFLLWTLDNPYITKDRVIQESAWMSNEEKKTLLFGIPSNITGKIYNYNKDIHSIKFENIPKVGVTLYNILDPHDSKPWAIQWWAVDRFNRCYCVDEYPDRTFEDILVNDKTYKDYADLIKSREENLLGIFGRTVSKRIIDPNFGNKTVQLSLRVSGQSGTTPVKELAKLGLKYHDGVDSLEAGHLQVKKMLRYIIKDDELIVRPKLYIYEKCINTINHLTKYSKDDKGRVIEKFKDFCDTTRYFVMSNPRYIDRVIKNNFNEIEKVY